ncbi:hypothetical protein ACFPIJ_52340 [Dactylosporangium cerinum]|uniref:Uncharacterized protein n=1 Tax=Dactylosporangium cerinum TaxID=1434730 RepID=A0ABV9WFS7_9ACTN
MLRTRGAELNWAAQPLCGAFETTDGAVVLVAVPSPVHLSETPATVRLPAPPLGQHTEEIRATLEGPAH